MRTSATPRSSSVWDKLGAHSFRVDDSRDRDDLVPAHDKRPRLAVRAGNLRVDEHVLDLLAPSGEPIARAPRAYLKAWHVGLDPPGAPPHLAIERKRALLEPHAVVFAHGRQAVAEIDAPGSGSRFEQLVETRRPLLGESQEVPLRRRVELPQQRGDLVARQA